MPDSSPPAVDYWAKAEAIRPWVDPEERVTVDFQDASELNAEVISCTVYVVELGLETFMPHSRQKVVVPLREVTTSHGPWSIYEESRPSFSKGEASTDH